MKLSIRVVAALGVLAASLAWAQQPTTGGTQGYPSASSKPLTVSGKVSNDGKTLMTDIDSVWGISNADALRDYEGRRVTVRCYVDTDRGQIHILSVRKKEESELKYAARHGDSAFRR
jgi:hypothetical protein